MPDEPKALPELIATLCVGSMISGECSAWKRTPNPRRVELHDKASVLGTPSEKPLPRLAKQLRTERRLRTAMILPARDCSARLARAGLKETTFYGENKMKSPSMILFATLVFVSGLSLRAGFAQTQSGKEPPKTSSV